MSSIPLHRALLVLAGLIATTLGVVVSAVPATAATPAYVIVGDDPTATGDQWGLHESYYSDLRNVLAAPANFGPSGVVNATFTVGTPRAVPLTTHSLDGVDVYFLSARDLAAGESTVLNAFVSRGGAVVTNANAPGFFDTTAWLGFALSPRVVYGDGGGGYTTTHRAPSPSAAISAQATSPLFAGPFGTATTFENWHTVAGFTALPSQATALARTTLTGPDNNGSNNIITITNVTTLATISAGALGTGSGPIIATSDVDTFSNAYTTALGDGASDALCTLTGTTNGIIARNAFAWLATQLAANGPPPSTTTAAPTTTVTPTTTAPPTTTSTTTTTTPPTITSTTIANAPTAPAPPPTAPPTISAGVPVRCRGSASGDPTVTGAAALSLAKYVPTRPTRLFDTRADGDAGYVCAGQTITKVVAGHAGVPTNGVTAVALNVTGVVSGGEGFVTVWPAGEARPNASNLNFTAAFQQRPNLVIVPLGEGGAVNLYAQTGAHLIADVAGYFVAANNASDGRLTPVAPTRLLDTRLGLGAPQAKPVAGSTTSLQITGRGGVPLNGVAAVVVNLTGADATAGGFVTAWPTGDPRPEASNLNLATAGDTAANLAIVRVGVGGQVDLYSEAGVHLLADVVGWFGDTTQPTASDGLFQPLKPARVFDTRPSSFVGAGGIATRRYLGTAGVASSGVAAVAVNITGTDAVAPGYITAWPSGHPMPVASNLNLSGLRDTRPNAAILPLGASGDIDHFAERGAHLIVDIAGYFTGSPLG